MLVTTVLCWATEHSLGCQVACCVTCPMASMVRCAVALLHVLGMLPLLLVKGRPVAHVVLSLLHRRALWPSHAAAAAVEAVARVGLRL